VCHVRNLTIVKFSCIKMLLLLKFHSCLQSRMPVIRVLADVLLFAIHTKPEKTGSTPFLSLTAAQ